MKPFCILLILILARTLEAATLGVLSASNAVVIEAFANNQVSVLRSVTSDANYAFMGFHAASELSQIDPIKDTNVLLIHTISLDRLRNYHVGDDFAAMLETPSTLRLIVPLRVNTSVRSSLSFRFEPSLQFSETKFGQRKLIRELTAIYQSIPPGRVKTDERPFVVELPVFDLWFIGYLTPMNRLVLLPTVDIRLGTTTIPRDKPLTETNMFKLATVALNYNGLPN